MRRPIGFLALLVLALAGYLLRDGEVPSLAPAPAPPAEVGKASEPGSGYILAVSWSPAWCEEEDPSGNTDQCEIGRNSGLVVHGLWAGSREDSRTFCDTDEQDRLPNDIAAQVRGFMPSVGLAAHEWKKHGSCMGLGQRGYFDTMEQAWQSIRWPSELSPGRTERRMETASLRQRIIAANPGLPANAISLQCDREGDFSEVRICLTADMKGRPCPSSTGRGCQKSLNILPPP